MIVRQWLGGVLVVGGVLVALLQLLPLILGVKGACDVNVAGVTMALGLAVCGGLLFDSDTFVRAIQAWRNKGDE